MDFSKQPPKEAFNQLHNKLNKIYNDIRNWNSRRTVDLFYHEKYTRK